MKLWFVGSPLLHLRRWLVTSLVTYILAVRCSFTGEPSRWTRAFACCVYGNCSYFIQMQCNYIYIIINLIQYIHYIVYRMYYDVVYLYIIGDSRYI